MDKELEKIIAESRIKRLFKSDMDVSLEEEVTPLKFEYNPVNVEMSFDHAPIASYFDSYYEAA